MIADSIAGYYTVPILLSLKMTNEVTLGENVEALKAKAENVFFLNGKKFSNLFVFDPFSLKQVQQNTIISYNLD